MTAAPAMKTKALAGWYGANRKLAAAVGAACGECAWVGVPFAGGRVYRWRRP